MSTTRIIDAARQLLKEYGYFMDELWHVDDVNFICEQQGLAKLTKEQAMRVFDIAKDQFDGEYGISWPQLEKALRIYFQREAALKRVSAE
ncbi:MAG: hypothetical protein GC137_08920 [Alphaproteobacteria bacterium]|nr:hypothetical protein [Alphaproteobacteria bacterium]